MGYLSIFCVLVFMAGCSSFDKLIFEKGKSHSQNLRVLWAHNFDPEYETGNLPISYNSPLVAGETIFLGNQQGEMYSFELSSGRVLWKSLDKKIFVGKPTVFENKIFYGTQEGRLIARNRYTGELFYEVDLGYAMDSTPVYSEGKLVVQLQNHALVVLEANSGKILWNYKGSFVERTTLRRWNHPLVAQGKVFFGTPEGEFIALALEDGRGLWTQKISRQDKFPDVSMTAVYHNMAIYVGASDEELKKIDPKTGQVLRSFPFVATRPILPMGRDFLVSTQEGKIIQSDDYGHVVKEFSMPESNIVALGPSFQDDGVIVASSDGHIYLVNWSDLAIEGKFPLGHRYSFIYGEMSALNNYLAFYSSRNRLYVMRK